MARPKRVFSDEEEQNIRQYAHNNCNTETIANALDIPVNTLKRRFGRILRQERAQGKVDLRDNQRNLSKTSADMCKFLGTNELDQQVKQVITTKVGKSDIPEAQKPAYKEAARVLKIRLAETGT